MVLRTHAINPRPAGNQASAFFNGLLVPFLCADEDERTWILTDQIKAHVAASLKKGVGRFEEPLAIVGLGGAVDEDVRRTLFQLHSVRNLVVHKDGIVDARFRLLCPLMAFEVGQAITITRNQYKEYWFAACWYSIELEMRRVRKAGEIPSERHAQVQESVLTALRQFNMEDPSGGR